MPRGYNNFSYVIDSSFQPFTMQEMLTPFLMYKEAFEKNEEAYNDLKTKADTFKYLSETLPEDSKARQIYEGYANNLNAQASDLASNGLTMGNRRALTGLKQRYQGEIGQLARASEQLAELQKGRNALAAAGKTMIYANDNPTIDDFLGDGNAFNRYSVDAADLRTRGAELGKAISSREYSNDEAGNLLQNQYRIWRQTHGIKDIDSFMQSDLVNDLVDRELLASGAATNLSGNGLRQAKLNLLNGLYQGIVYEETARPIENQEYIGAKDRASLALSWANHNESVRQHNLQMKIAGYDENGVYHPEWDQSVAKAKAIQEAKNAGKASGGSGKGSGSEYGAINQDRIRVSWKGNNPEALNGDSDDDVDITPVEKDEQYTGKPYYYDDLPQYAKSKVDRIIGNKGDYDNYMYFFKPYKGGFFNDQEAELDIVPRKVMKDNASEGDDMMFDFGVQ